MNDQERQRFDDLMEEAIESLPEGVRAMIDEVPIIVLDRPTPELLRELGVDPADEAAALEFCGLHTGTMLTERSVERSADLPTDIHLFREGIIDLAGGWDQPEADDCVYEEIWVTLLHEIGHHFGLEEDDLERLGFD